MAVYTHCCRAQPLRQLGFLVYNYNIATYSVKINHSRVENSATPDQSSLQK